MDKRPLHVAGAPRLSAVAGLSQDPWAGFELCSGASEADKAAYAKIRTEITESGAVGVLRELAPEAWWRQQGALISTAERDGRMLSLLRNAIPYHKKKMDDHKKKMDDAAVASHIERKIAQLYKTHGNKGHSGELTPEGEAIRQAFEHIKANPSLITPKMLEEAHEAFAAHQSSLEQQKKAADAAKVRAEQEREARAAAKLTEVLVGGWA
jgi:hypothetical protein